MLTLERGGPRGSGPGNAGTGNSGAGPARGGDPGRTRRQAGGWGAVVDLLAVLAAAVLVGLGVLNLYAVGEPDLALRQLATAAVGLLLLVMLWNGNGRGRFLTVLGWGCYGFAVLFLLLVPVIGIEANGATRWLALGPVTFQPSELAKLGLLLVLATVLGSGLSPWRRFVLALALVPVPIVLVALQPDLSTATLLTTLSVAMLVLGRVPGRFLLPVFGAAVVVAPLTIRLLRPYQLERVHAFLAGPGSEAGWAALQAHIALARGGWFGLARDPMHELYAEYLPEGHTDLALASVVEHWGVLAGVAAVLAAVVLVWRFALASRVARTRQAALVAAGLAVLFGVEVVISVGANLGLLPLAGVPFPLLSFGGTAALVHLAAFGVVLGIRRDGARRRLWVPPRWRNPRPRLVRFTALGVTAVLCGFVSFGWHLLSSKGEALRILGLDQATRCLPIPAPRGMIMDRHGAALATTRTTAQVVAIPELMRRSPGAVARLAELTGQPVAALNSAVAAARATDVWLPVADLPVPAGARVAAAELPGVVVVPQHRRSYPTGPLLAPLLGFVGVATPAEVDRWPDLRSSEVVGRAGIEAQYDSVLRGVDGEQCVYVDPIGVPEAPAHRRDPMPGGNLALSLDLGLQQQLTAGLDTAVQAASGGRAVGAAVAMDPRNGQILAMASLPSYDNNIYGPPVDSAALQQVSAAPGAPLVEHVTRIAVPPGSTFKLVTGAAGVLHPWVPPDEVIPTGGSFTLGNHTFNNWRSFGPQNLIQAIAWSNDVYFYKLAWTLGPDALIETARAFGVGQPTGIDLPGENPGYLGTPDSVHERGATWYPGSTVILGIGQGYLTVTPLQNARWTAAVATGHLVTPHLGLATGTGSGAQVALPASAPTPLPFAAGLGPVRDGMRAAVQEGTAKSLQNVGVPVGAKTGTAEDPGIPAGGEDHWMTAAAPHDDPRIVVTALVQGGGAGGSGSASVVNLTMRHFFAHQDEILGTVPMQQP